MNPDISIYLLKDGINIEQILSLELGWNEIERAGDNPNPEVLTRCFVKQNDPIAPKWTNWISEAFRFGEQKPKNQSSGVVVTVETKGRIFALTFGTGWHSLPSHSYDPDFGLRVALNQVSPQRLRQIVTKTVDIRTKEKSTYNYVGSNLNEFDLNVDVEWLRSASGKTTRADCTLVAGSDALKLFRYSGSPDQLGPLCSEALKIFNSGVPEIFKFMDNLRPVGKHEAIFSTLEQQLNQLLTADAVPDNVEFVLDAEFGLKNPEIKLKHKTSSKEFIASEAAFTEIWSTLKELQKFYGRLELDRILIQAIDSNGDVLLNDRLTDCIQAEIIIGPERYIRVEKRWFKAGSDYLKTIEERLGKLPDVSHLFKLPRWDRTTEKKELDYNTKTSNTFHWLLQDQELIYPPGSAGVETCDMLSPEGDFFHVKDGVDATAIHHLLGQISGAANLLSRETSFYAEVKKRYEDNWKGKQFADVQPRFIAAIGRAPGQDIFGRMLLPKINILDHARRVQAAGFRFAVAKFEVVPDATKAPKTSTAIPKATKSKAV